MCLLLLVKVKALISILGSSTFLIFVSRSPLQIGTGKNILKQPKFYSENF